MIVRHHDLGQFLYTITHGSVGNVLACLRGGFDIADETGVTFRYKDYLDATSFPAVAARPAMSNCFRAFEGRGCDP
jgi:hypothetical protein